MTQPGNKPKINGFSFSIGFCNRTLALAQNPHGDGTAAQAGSPVLLRRHAVTTMARTPATGGGNMHRRLGDGRRIPTSAEQNRQTQLLLTACFSPLHRQWLPLQFPSSSVTGCAAQWFSRLARNAGANCLWVSFSFFVLQLDRRCFQSSASSTATAQAAITFFRRLIAATPAQVQASPIPAICLRQDQTENGLFTKPKQRNGDAKNDDLPFSIWVPQPEFEE